MTVLGKLILALLALGVQLPAKPVLALCLCEVLPFTCAVGGSCPSGRTAAPACCEPTGFGGAEEPERACCGCELDLGQLEADPARPIPPRAAGEWSLAAALPHVGAESPGARALLGTSRPRAARGSPQSGARINSPLRI